MTTASSSWRWPHLGHRLVAGALAGVAYALIGLAGRLALPWSRVTTVTVPGEGGPAVGEPPGVAGRGRADLDRVLQAFTIDPLVAKSPVAVVRYLFAAPAPVPIEICCCPPGPHAPGRRVGFVAGLVAAVVVALAFVLVRERGTGTAADGGRAPSVPLVALTPLLTLVFGRGLMGTTPVISGLVVFSPRWSR